MADLQAQLEAVTSGVLLRPMPELGTLMVVGPERQSWLAGLVTADLKALSAGQGCYALNVTRTGKVQAELWIAVDEDKILVAVHRELVDGLYQAMDTFLIMEDAELSVAPERHGWWLAHGPKSASVAEVARGHGAVAVTARWGELDTAIVAAPARVDHNLTDVLGSVDGAVLATPGGWERIRIERMLPRFGVDFQVDCYPQEACLETLAISFSKGCYVGQEAVFKLEKRGHVNKRLVRLVLDGEVPLEPGTEVTSAEGQVVGQITSATQGDGKTWALAMVRYKQSASGTKLGLVGQTAQVSCLSGRA